MLFDEVTGLFDDAYGLFDDGAVKNDIAIVTGQSASTSVGLINVTGTAFVSITGVISSANAGNVSASGDALVSVTGQSVTATAGLTTANGQLDATTSIDGITINASTGIVTAASQQAQTSNGTISKKKTSYWLKNSTFAHIQEQKPEVINSSISLVGNKSKTFISDVFADGQIKISAQINLVNVYSFAKYKNIKVSGIINPTDEEIIYLMAA
ncbi:MAG: hypothetical protein ACO27B_04365 [Ilumatobacteraceae bacterium]